MPSQSPSAPEVKSATRRMQSIGRTMAVMGMVAAATGLNIFIFGSLPLLLLNPAWQLQLISNVIASSPYLLFGCFMVYVSRYFDGENKTIQALLKAIKKLSLAMIVLLLFFVPFQFYAANNLIKQRSVDSFILFKSWEKAIAAIKSSSDEDEFRRIVSSLEGSDKMPAVFDAPFPIIKDRALRSLNSKLRILKTEAENSVPSFWQQFIGNAFRNFIQIVVLAAGFGSLSTENVKSKIFQVLRLKPSSSANR